MNVRIETISQVGACSECLDRTDKDVVQITLAHVTFRLCPQHVRDLRARLGYVPMHSVRNVGKIWRWVVDTRCQPRPVEISPSVVLPSE